MATETLTNEEKTAALQTNLRSRNIGLGDNLSVMLENVRDYGITVPTGFADIDEALHGGFRTGLNILAAPPGSGKSTLALYFAERFSAMGVQTVYVTNDMSEEELVCKAISRNSYEIVQDNGFEAEQVLGLKGNISESQVFREACKMFQKNAQCLRFVGDDTSINLAEIKMLITHYGAYGTGSEKIVIIIDYLQNIRMDGANGDKERLDALVRELKELARKYKLVVLAISSVNRASYNYELTMASLKESGGIEFGADLVLGLQYKGVGGDGFDLKTANRKPVRDMELVVLKQRFGQVGATVSLQYYTKFDLIPFNDDRPTLKKSR